MRPTTARRIVVAAALCTPLAPVALRTLPAAAANLPTPTGATGAQRGTAAALAPIVRLQTAVRAATDARDLAACAAARLR